MVQRVGFITARSARAAKGFLSEANISLIEYSDFCPAKMWLKLYSIARKNKYNVKEDLDLLLCFVCSRGTKFGKVLNKMSKDALQRCKN